jgi:CMP-N-acetylneuraminic acid synthetase
VIVALVIGKHKSMGCPGKNIRPILGRPMVEYAFIAAKNSPYVEKIFTSTDSPHIAKIGKKYDAEHIKRPPKLATPDALTEDALTHAYNEMSRRTGKDIEIVVLLFANAPTIMPGLIDKGIEKLKSDKSLDSAFSVCKYNMWAPLRARRIDKDNLIQPYIPLKYFGNKSTMSSIRGGEGDCYFCDLSVQIIRGRCFKEMDTGILPFKWMGKKSYALKSDYGFDIDYEWQIPVIEHWLISHGFTEKKTPCEG